MDKDLKQLYREAFLEGEFEYPSLFLSHDDKLKYTVRFPLYVDDEESYAVALNKAMMLASYNNDINCAGLFVATDEEYLFFAKSNKIKLFEITPGGEFVELESNILDTFSNTILREYLSVYSRKDYTDEVTAVLHEQGFEVNAL